MADTQQSELKTIEADVEKAVKWGTSHIVMLAIIAGCMVVAVYLYDSKRADQADARAATIDAVAKQKDADNAAFQQQSARQQAARDAAYQQLQQQVAGLLQVIASRNQKVATQVAEAPKLQPPELAKQWAGAAAEPVPGIDAGGNFVVPLPLATKSYVALIQVPVLAADVADQKAAMEKQAQEIDNRQAALASEKVAHQSDVDACKADKLALNADLLKAKADARKSKFHWFISGAGTAAALIFGFVK
jgi:hypothetical protein